MNDTLFEGLLAVALGLAAFDGWRNTRRLWRKNSLISPELPGSFGLVPWSYIVVALLATTAASWYGLLAIRRLFDLAPIDWSPIVSVIIATGVFLIPRFFVWIWHRIESDPANDIPELPE